MAYDLTIKNGLIVDGSGRSAYHSDLGIKDGRIAFIGAINEHSAKVIDAEGHVVAPGFVDGHTHMDAQVFWDRIGSCSCYHGVTSVVMGNCGFSLAPCRESDADYVFRNLERAEDISREAMLAGITWQWETYPEYMDALDRTPKGINYAGYIGHSALRTHVMGQRAFTEAATEEEVELMAQHVVQAVRAGAIGFSTSRSRNHETSDRKPVSSRLAAWDEVKHIVRRMGQTGAGMFEIAAEDTGRDPERIRDYQLRLKQLAVEYGVPVTWGMFSSRHAPDRWRDFFALLDEVEEEGGAMFAQVHSRALNVLYSFESHLPFDHWNEWREIRRLPLVEQKALFLDPAVRQRLIDTASRPSERHKARGALVPPPDWHWIFVMDKPSGGERRMDEVAAEKGVTPAELMIDLGIESDFKCFFRQPIANEINDDVIEMMKHPRSAVTFSDSGAHVSQIMDSSLQTHIFEYWVRDRQELTVEQAVKMVTSDNANRWGLSDRGRLAEGLAADIAVFDPERIGPNMPEVVHDLPSGAQRLKQTAKGILATVVNGEVLLQENEHTGAQPGKLLRGPLARSG